MSLSLNLQSTDSRVHIVSPENIGRLNYSKFISLVGYLKKQFNHRLNCRLYRGQRVYEYTTTIKELKVAIAKYDSKIKVK